MSHTKKIAIIGLGYVGLPLAVEFGKHRATLGFDINQARIHELQSGQDHTLECSPEELQSATHLSFSANAADLQAAQIYIVTVPTPVDQANRPDMTPLIKASETVGKVLKAGDIVIYESTVYPGATEEVCVPVLEKFSGLKFITDGSPRSARDDDSVSLRGTKQSTPPIPSLRGACDEAIHGFYCGYSPELINPGDKEQRLSIIKKVTSGSTPEVAEEVDALYSGIIKAGTCKASSIKVAEAAQPSIYPVHSCHSRRSAGTYGARTRFGKLVTSASWARFRRHSGRSISRPECRPSSCGPGHPFQQASVTHRVRSHHRRALNPGCFFRSSGL